MSTRGSVLVSDEAPELGVSTGTIIKACKRMAIPRPRQGHWTRVNLGQAPKRRLLGKLPQGKEDHVRINPWNRHRITRPDVERPQSAEEGIDESPWIERTRRALSRARPDKERGTLTPKGKVLPIVVSEPEVERSLDIMAKVLAVAATNGWNVAVKKRPENFRKCYGWLGPCLPYAATVEVDGVVLEISLEEKLSGSWKERPASERRRLGIWGLGKIQVFERTGILRFRVHGIEGTGGRQSWSDTVTNRLENKIDDIVLGLAGAAVTYREREEAKRLQELERQKELRRRAEEAERRRRDERRRLEEQRRAEHLVSLADSHDAAGKIRALMDALEKSERASGG